MPSWSCNRVRIGPNKFPPEIAVDALTANIAASRCRGCFSGHYEHIGGAWDHHRPRVVPFPKRVKKTWPSTAYSFAPPDPFVPIQVPTPTYLGPARGWSRWRGVPGRYYGNPFCLSGANKSTAHKIRAKSVNCKLGLNGIRRNYLNFPWSPCLRRPGTEVAFPRSDAAFPHARRGVITILVSA